MTESYKRYTAHARERLSQRRISSKQVAKAMRMGEWIWLSSKNSFMVTGAGLRLILSWDGVVITGYRMQDRLFA